MNRMTLVSVVALLLSLAAGCASERTIPVSDVPDPVLAAARQAMPGISINEVEMEKTRVYDVEGTANGKEWEIEITAEGKVIEIREEEQ